MIIHKIWKNRRILELHNFVFFSFFIAWAKHAENVTTTRFRSWLHIIIITWSLTIDPCIHRFVGLLFSVFYSQTTNIMVIICTQIYSFCLKKMLKKSMTQVPREVKNMWKHKIISCILSFSLSLLFIKIIAKKVAFSIQLSSHGYMYFIIFHHHHHSSHLHLVCCTL